MAENDKMNQKRRPSYGRVVADTADRGQYHAPPVTIDVLYPNSAVPMESLKYQSHPQFTSPIPAEAALSQPLRNDAENTVDQAPLKQEKSDEPKKEEPKKIPLFPIAYVIGSIC